MELAAGVEVHHLGVGIVVVIDFSTLLRLVHHLCYLQHFLHGMALRLVEPLWVQLDTRLRRKELTDLLDESDTVLLLIDVIGDVSFRIVAHSEPVEDVSDQFKVRVAEVLNRNVSVVTE